MISNILKCGDKIEIKAEKQMVDGVRVNIDNTCFSSVYDFVSEEEIIVNIPMEKGHLILLPNGMMIQLLLYCGKGLYNCNAIVKERYKKDNMYLMNLEIKSQLKKFQRRNYYRLNCLVDLDYRILAPDLEIKPLTEEVLDTYIENEGTSEIFSGTIVDISGGGLRFMSKNENQKGSRMLLSFILESTTLQYEPLLIGELLSCYKTDLQEVYENRLQFLQIEESEREKIVKYIFDEERRTRNLKKG